MRIAARNAPGRPVAPPLPGRGEAGHPPAGLPHHIQRRLRLLTAGMAVVTVVSCIAVARVNGRDNRRAGSAVADAPGTARERSSGAGALRSRPADNGRNAGVRPGSASAQGGHSRADCINQGSGVVKDAPLPTDPFQRCAVRALRGDFGPLELWQRAAYERGLRLGLRAEWPIVATAYWRGEGRSGQVDCRGRRLGDHAAASNIIPQGWIVWLPQVGLRRICDRGAHSNDVVAARRRGIWVDVWFESAAAARAAGVDGWVRTRAVLIPPE